MLSAISGLLQGVVGPTLEKYFEFKGKETEKTIKLEEFELMKKQIEAEMQLKLQEEINRPDSEFKKFMMDYEGKATEMPRAVQIMRGSVRPLVTYWSLGLITWIIMSAGAGSAIGENMAGMPDQLWWIFLAVFGFWFGGRAMENVQAVKQKGQLEQVREEGAIKVAAEKEKTRQKVVIAEAEKQKTQQIVAQTQPAAVAPAPATKARQEEWDPWKEYDLD
jgi:hypothetical protein